MLRRFASWRNPRRRPPVAGSAPLPRVRHAGPRSPPFASLRPRRGRRGQGRAVSRPWGRGFFVGWRLGALMRLRRLDAACVRAGCKNPLRKLRGILPPARPLRSPVGRPQPHFCPKAHALLEYSCRGPFTKTVVTTRFPLPTSAELVFRETFPSTRTFEYLITLSAPRFCYSTKAKQKRTRTTGA